MKILCVIFCAAACILSGCQGIYSSKTASAHSVVKAPDFDRPPGPSDSDLKSELGFMGQRSNTQIWVRAQVYEVILRDNNSTDIDWTKKPEGDKKNPAILMSRSIALGSGAQAKSFITDAEFGLDGMPHYLNSQGVTSLVNSQTVYTLDGMNTPVGTAEIKGYLTELSCQKEGRQFTPGRRESSFSLAITPKFIDGSKLFITASAAQSQSATEPSDCSKKGDPIDVVELSKTVVYGSSFYLKSKQALVISGIHDSETTSSNTVKVLVLTAGIVNPK
jgi:hypothetical protein